MHCAQCLIIYKPVINQVNHDVFSRRDNFYRRYLDTGFLSKVR